MQSSPPPPPKPLSAQRQQQQPPPKITLYFDILSPFAYIAYSVLTTAHAFRACEITYVPVLLGGLMRMCGNTPPLMVKNKDTYISAQRTHLAALFAVPISPLPPPGFPLNTLTIQRCLAALQDSHPHLLPAAMRCFWERFWVRWDDALREEKVVAVLRDVVGGEEEARRVWERAGTEGRERLRRNTDEAFASGAFGVPWFVATNAKGETAGFWGVDHMGLMCDHLGLIRPDARGWRALL